MVPGDLLNVAKPETLAGPPRAAGFVSAVVGRTWLCALALVLGAAAIRAWIALKIQVPVIMTDELIYRELAASFARTGRFAVREESIGLYSLYPVLIAPFWRIGSIATSYDMSKVLNVIAMTSASLLLFVWARKLVRARYALAVLALSLLLPTFLYTTELMTESVALPAFLLALFAIWRSLLLGPTLGRQAQIVGAVALACAIRVQGVVLVLVWATSIALWGALAAGGKRRVRSAVGALRPYWPSALLLSVLACGYLALTAARGKSALGFYDPVTSAPYSIGKLALWFVYHLGELSIAAGFVPAAAFLLLLGHAFRRPADPAVAALLAVTLAAVVWFVAAAATWASWHGDGIRERYDFYAVPLLLLAFAVFLERGAVSGRAALAAGVVACVLPIALPVPRLLTYGILAKAPSLDGLRWLADQSSDLVRPAVVVFALLAFVVVLLRLPPGVAFGFVATLFLLNTLAATALAHDLSSRIRNASLASSWVDARLGRGADAGVVWTGNIDANWVWQTEFWNDSVRRVYYTRERDPGTLPTLRLVSERGSHELRAGGRPLPVEGLVTDRSFTIDGAPIRSLTNGLSLIRVTPATTSGAVVVRGVYGDGWTGPELSYTRPKCRGVTRLVFAFRSSVNAPAQTATMEQAGHLLARRHVSPDPNLFFLRVPLDASRGTCTIRVLISPTWRPAARVAGSTDPRKLGLIYESASVLP